MVRGKNPESFKKIYSTSFEIFRIFYVISMPKYVRVQDHKNGVNVPYSFTLSVVDLAVFKILRPF